MKVLTQNSKCGNMPKKGGYFQMKAMWPKEKSNQSLIHSRSDSALVHISADKCANGHMSLTRGQREAKHTSTIHLDTCRGFSFCYYGQKCSSSCLWFILAGGNCAETKLKSKFIINRGASEMLNSKIELIVIWYVTVVYDSCEHTLSAKLPD